MIILKNKMYRKEFIIKCIRNNLYYKNVFKIKECVNIL